MAYVDSQLEFSDSQAVTATAASTNIVDFKTGFVDAGVGRDIYFVCNVTVDMTDAGSDSTITVTLETDDNEAFSSATTAQTIGTFPALSLAGTRLVAKLQPEKITEQFLRVQYTTTNGDLTTGSFDAFLTLDIDAFTAYPSGSTITN